MSGFAGFFDTDGTVKEDRYSWMALVRRMAQRLSHRGLDGKHTYISDYCALASMGTFDNAQAYTFTDNNYTYHITLDGKVANHAELRNELLSLGIQLEGNTDAELILKSYLHFHKQCTEKLEGSFSFVIDDGASRTLFLCRDRFGIKPLFYTLSGGRFVFASEIKGLFEYPGVRPILGRTGLCELFGFGGVRTPGCGIFENIAEIKPGHYAVYDSRGFREYAYWQLKAKPFADTPTAAERAIRRITALGTAEHAKDSPTAPPEDDGFDLFQRQTKDQSDKAVSFTYSVQKSSDVTLRLLIETAIARDLPTYGQNHLNLFSRFRYAAGHSSSVLFPIGSSGMYSSPDSFDYKISASVLHPDISAALDIPSYIQEKTADALHSCPALRGESAENRRIRQQKFIFIQKQLPHALECADRYSMYCGLHIEASFADREQLEYIFNLPKCLFDKLDLSAVLPGIFISYPKHEAVNVWAEPLNDKLSAILSDTNQPLNRLISRERVKIFLRSEPQNIELLLWLLQLNLWMNHYKIRLTL